MLDRTKALARRKPDVIGGDIVLEIDKGLAASDMPKRLDVVCFAVDGRDWCRIGREDPASIAADVSGVETFSQAIGSAASGRLRRRRRSARRKRTGNESREAFIPPAAHRDDG